MYKFVLFLLLFLLSSQVSAQVEMNQGQITINIPSSICEKSCTGLTLIRNGNSVSTFKFKPDDSITLTSLPDGQYELIAIKPQKLASIQKFTISNKSNNYLIAPIIVSTLFFSSLIYTSFFMHRNDQN